MVYGLNYAGAAEDALNLLIRDAPHTDRAISHLRSEVQQSLGAFLFFSFYYKLLCSAPLPYLH